MPDAFYRGKYCHKNVTFLSGFRYQQKNELFCFLGQVYSLKFEDSAKQDLYNQSK
jgi:hypothetical protein